MKVFIASYKILPELRGALEREGEVVLLSENAYLPFPEAAHADMQVYDAGSGSLTVKNGLCPEACAKLISLGFELTFAGRTAPQKYPECASLNVLKCGNYILHKLSATDPAIMDLAAAGTLVFVNVSQGYTGCSSVYVDDLDLIVSGDPSVINASAKHSFNLFRVEDEVTAGIELEGLPHGFIGGACGYDRDSKTFYVNGNLEKQLPALYNMLRSAGVRVVQAESEEKLFDIGGIKTAVS